MFRKKEEAERKREREREPKGRGENLGRKENRDGGKEEREREKDAAVKKVGGNCIARLRLREISEVNERGGLIERESETTISPVVYTRRHGRTECALSFSERALIHEARRGFRARVLYVI